LKSISRSNSCAGSVEGLNTHLYFCLDLTATIAAVKLESQQPTKQHLPPAVCRLHYIQFFALLLFLEDSHVFASYTYTDLYSTSLWAGVKLWANQVSLNLLFFLLISPQIPQLNW